jgi:hypothetical protein
MSFISDIFDEVLNTLTVQQIAPPKPKRKSGTFDMSM